MTAPDTSGYLDMDLLRFTTAGSVDDGKSTLIGRLLYDSQHRRIGDGVRIALPLELDFVRRNRARGIGEKHKLDLDILGGGGDRE